MVENLSTGGRSNSAFFSLNRMQFCLNCVIIFTLSANFFKKIECVIELYLSACK